ncbi:DEIH-box ATPase [Thelotrema lepadinum]|nr:DEIH-box ATPase [Thelotrema lepadinum]
MADPNNVSQYKYAAMSNLVLQHDRRFSTRRTDEATGDPESLAGRIKAGDMGGRVDRANTERGGQEKTKKEKGKPEPVSDFAGADTFVEGLQYRPRTAATRETYNYIIAATRTRLVGDISQSMVLSVADAVLEFLKDENLKQFDKKKEIEDVLGVPMTSEEFNQLTNIGAKITDYHVQDEEMEDAENEEEEELDERQGVAVAFDESGDEDEDGIKRTNEVRDEDDDSDEDEEEKDRNDGAEESTEQLVGSDDDEMIIDGGISTKTQDRDRDKALKLSARDIDAFWLQRKIGSVYTDAHDQQSRTQKALQILENEDSSTREVENLLMELMEYEHHEIVEVLVANRRKIVFVTQWRQLQENSQERVDLEQQMIAAGQRALVSELHGHDEDEVSGYRQQMKLDLMDISVPTKEEPKAKGEGGAFGGLLPKRLINLENLVFDRGNHLMTNSAVKLPQGSTKRSFKGYEEIHVPAPKSHKDTNEKALMSASELPEWAQLGFGSAPKLNRIQTTCFNSAFNSDENLLICAPTGSGKTNVAFLALLREIGKHRNENGEIMLDDFKIVYIAPLKALVQEQVGNFGQRLEPYGIRVSELTGDRQLTKEQIASTQIIVTTPEKWDVITRKATDVSYTNLVRLICIDEIHLLHDDRGPVLESIVARTIRKVDRTGDPVRFVGLSATLPNFKDVASFLRVNPQKGLFHFDSSFRPCPLKQEFIGLTDRKPVKQLKTINEVCYTKVMEQVGTNKQQLLIFVHSRKETAKTAKYIRDKALELETIGQILRSDAASREVLNEEAQGVQDRDLKDLLPYSFAIHHAGMNRADRTSVEELFSEGMVQVLVCTATLAWGVNLPAHAVIIKGTQIYSPEKGSWVELSPQDVLQMLGRAGRPQYDTYGEGIIITTQNEIQYYLSLLNQQLPIESQLVSKLIDCLNAEVVLGNVRSRQEGVEWLGYTYLFVRMLRSPGLYSVGTEYEDDDVLEQKRVDLIHSAATQLEKCGLVKYEKKTGELQSTELGRIASHFYISHSSMSTYNQHIQPMTSTIELFRVFALSEEFKYIPVRADEKVELQKLLGRVPIPVKESVEMPHAKINVLLQAYISRLSLEGLALMSDLVYVTQSAGRILRAIFEIALQKRWSEVAKTALSLCKMAEKRMWPTMTPLRQLPCPRDIVQKAEKIEVPWSSYFDLDPPRMGELLGMPRAGKTVCNLVSKFPRLSVDAQVQPITHSLLRVELTITPTFEWDNEIHGTAEHFWIIVEDCDGEEILFHDRFMLRGDYATSEMNEHLVEFTVPMEEPKPPHYFVSLISDRWLAAETKVTLSFRKLILPERFPPHTKLLELQPLSVVSALKRPDFQKLYTSFSTFNKIQTQTFNSLFTTDDNVFVGASTGSGKTICAEFALLRHWASGAIGRAIYVAPFQELVDQRHADWQARLGQIDGGKTVVKLTGDITTDLKILEQGDLVLATPPQWDVLSRQWQRRKNVQTVKVFIADELHMLGDSGGYTYEIIVSRMHYISLQTENAMRIIALSVPLSNALDLGQFIGASKNTIYNFSPHVRSTPIDLHIQPFTIPHFPSLMLAMAKPTYSNIVQMSPDKPAIVFVPTRKQVRLSAADLLSACVADDDEDRFLNAKPEEIQPFLERVQEPALAESISHGIGYYHEALSTGDKRIVSHLYTEGALQVMIASRDVCWELNVTCYLCIIMGTQYYEGIQHRYIDYPISEVLQMLGKANRAIDKSSRGVLMTGQIKKDYYKKLLNEALPIESHLQIYLHDAFVSEISTKVIASTQDAVDWTTYTYFYRRLLANPSYYGLVDVTHQGLSAYLSELVENTLKDLTEAKLIEADEEDDTITPLNAAMIAAYYNISYVTIQTFLLSLTGRTKLKQILEIVTSATEFESIQIRRHEDGLLKRIYDRLPVKLAQVAFESPHFKAFILLQAHLSRLDLPIDLAKDQEIILSKIITLLSSCVDVLSSEAFVQPATAAMELSQMCVQAMWSSDSPLKQIPNFAPDTIAAAQASGINDVFDFMEAMSGKKSASIVKALQLDKKQLKQAADFTNKYPSVDLEFEVLERDEVMAGAPSYLKIKIQRETDDDDDEEAEPDTTVEAPYFPIRKTENWWLVVGNTNSLLAIKKVSFGRQLEIKLEYVVPEPGKQDVKLYLISDSYVGVDQEHEFSITAAEGMEEDEEEEEEEE